jgi:hypothetical protein
VNTADKQGKAIGILQPGYLPWLGFFEQVGRVDVFVLYDDVQYDKGGWRNRNRIKGPTGPLWLTVPVSVNSSERPSICDVRIDRSRPWAEKQIKTVRQYYGKARFFSDYAEEFFGILARPWDLLVSLDIELIHWLAGKFGLTTPVLRSSEMGIEGPRIQRLVDIIKFLGGSCFYEGAAGKDYIDVNEFNGQGIEVQFQDYQHPTYPQLHGKFVSHLSALDLLLNCGPESRPILMLEQRKES